MFNKKTKTTKMGGEMRDVAFRPFEEPPKQPLTAREAHDFDLDMLSQEQLNSLCLLYTSPSPRDRTRSRMPSSA